jgi:hypothetical protein
MTTHPPGLVAIPALDQMFTHAVESLARLEMPPGSELVFAKGGARLDLKRNALMEHFLRDRRFAWTLLLDSDHTFAPNLLLRLLDHELPLVGVPAFGRVPPYELMAWETPTKRLVRRRGGLREVWMTGTGCLLVRRDVVERLQPPYFAWPQPPDPGGEDTWFCRRVAATGVPIVVDLDTPIGHVGSVPIDGAVAAAHAHTLAGRLRQWVRR